MESAINVTTKDMLPKGYRFEYAMNELLGYLGETDVLTGQGLRRQLGPLSLSSETCSFVFALKSSDAQSP